MTLSELVTEIIDDVLDARYTFDVENIPPVLEEKIKKYTLDKIDEYKKECFRIFENGGLHIDELHSSIKAIEIEIK